MITDATYGRERKLKNGFLLAFSIVGACLTTLEILSYVILFYHVWKHDNKTASFVLDQKVIGMRNRVNAISLTGLFATWVMEVNYIVFGGFLLLLVDDSNFIREVVALVKLFDFYLIPLVQIYTSVPMKRFKAKTQ
jgi:hypothetical protein